MGISKIFKDKPKDEDAALPEKDGKKKKKQSKKDKAKAEASPAAVSHAIAEPDRTSEDEDRALAGLSPAAKLARQHTLKSKAEQARLAREGAKTGEPAWDNNTTTRNNQQQSSILPSISSVAGPPEVLHVTPGRTSTTVRAVQVSEHEYDSEDDSSDGETIEDVTIQLAKSRLSDNSAADKEFREAWGSAYIDRDAVPKKGILKGEQLGAWQTRHLELTCSNGIFGKPGEEGCSTKIQFFGWHTSRSGSSWTQPHFDRSRRCSTNRRTHTPHTYPSPPSKRQRGRSSRFSTRVIRHVQPLNRAQLPLLLTRLQHLGADSISRHAWEAHGNEEHDVSCAKTTRLGSRMCSLFDL